MTCHFSEHFVLRSEAAIYFSKNVWVSVNKIHYLCQHLLFHPEKTSYFRKKFVVSLWHCMILQRTPVLLHLTWLITLTYTLAFHPDIAYYSSEYLLRSVRHAFYISGNFLSCSYNKSQWDALFLNFVLVKNSTCFRQIYCPSSGVLTLYSQQLVFVILVMLTVC